MKRIITTTIAILLLFASCSDDSNDMPPTETITQRLKGDLFQEIEDGSVISFEKTQFFEGILKQDGCWQMADYKIVMTNETYDTMNASLTANDATVSMEIYLSPSGESLNIKLFDSEYVLNYDYRLIDECFKR